MSDQLSIPSRETQREDPHDRRGPADAVATMHEHLASSKNGVVDKGLRSSIIDIVISTPLSPLKPLRADLTHSGKIRMRFWSSASRISRMR